MFVKAPVTPETPVRVRESNSRKLSLTVLTGDKGWGASIAGLG
jgi:hypothetical protein